jgi:hypothetical protein
VAIGPTFPVSGMADLESAVCAAVAELLQILLPHHAVDPGRRIAFEHVEALPLEDKIIQHAVVTVLHGNSVSKSEAVNVSIESSMAQEALLPKSAPFFIRKSAKARAI